MTSMLKYFFVFLAWFPDHASSDPMVPGENMIAYEFRDSNTLFGENSNRVYYYKDYVVYEKTYYFDSSVSNMVTPDTTTDAVFPATVFQMSEVRSTYFVFHRDSLYGMTYDVHRSEESEKRLPVDSMYGTISVRNTFEKMPKSAPDSISWNAGKSVLQHSYLFESKVDTPGIRVNLFFAPAMMNMKESLNSHVDSIMKMKFFKFEILIDSFYDVRNKVSLPPQYFSTELRRCHVKNEKEIKGYIDRYNAWRSRK